VFLVLDGGSSLMGEWLSLASDGRVMVEAMTAMGYDAMVLGRMDLIKGPDVAKARAREANFPLLSANLVAKDTRQPLFDPYAVIIKNGVRIAIIGLTDEDSLAMPGVADVALVLDPDETARQVIEALQPHVDAIIVLSRLGLERDRALAFKVPGIQVIVGGQTRRLLRQPEQVGNTLIVQQGYDGEWLGYLSATFDAQGAPRDVKMESITLTGDFPDDQAMVELLERYRAQYPAPTPGPTRTVAP
jgi:2',3'-cyclic-nucleotide 2'-phosphodiesterase (5'-nucleotidase family)